MISSRSSGPWSDARVLQASRPAAHGLVVELIGPAAAGKSTLAQELYWNAETRTPLALWGLPRRSLARNGLRLLPQLLALRRDPRPPTGRQLAQLIRVETLRQVVERRRVASRACLVLDEGPVFALSWMEVFYPDRIGPRLMAWRRQVLESWAHLLDCVVMLDAPTPLLVSRMRARAKPHPVKHGSDAEIREFLERFRIAFGHVLTDLRALGGPRVVTFETTEEVGSHIVASVVAALDGRSDGR